MIAAGTAQANPAEQNAMRADTHSANETVIRSSRFWLASIFPAAANNASELCSRICVRRLPGLLHAFHGEIRELRYGRPYFGFADHVK